jgi:hypothetical protein
MCGELPKLTIEQFQVLHRFGLLEATIEEVRSSLAGVFEFDFAPGRRTAATHFRVPEPGVKITREDISNALEKRRLGKISERDLVFWATMVLLNDAYEIDPSHEDEIADWLNDLSYCLDSI